MDPLKGSQRLPDYTLRAAIRQLFKKTFLDILQNIGIADISRTNYGNTIVSLLTAGKGVTCLNIVPSSKKYMKISKKCREGGRFRMDG